MLDRGLLRSSKLLFRDRVALNEARNFAATGVDQDLCSCSATETKLIIINAYAGLAARLTDFVEFESVYVPLAARFAAVEVLVPSQIRASVTKPANLTIRRLPGGLTAFPIFIEAAIRTAVRAASGGSATIWAQDPIVCGISGLIAARRTSARFVVDLHNNFWSDWDRCNPVARLHGYVARRIVRQADRVCAVSQWIADSSGLSEVVVIPSPVRLDAFTPDTLPDPVFAQFDEAPVVISAALVPRKGHRLLLSALALLIERHDLPPFVFIGDGPEAGRLAQMAFSLGLKNKIIFAGRQCHARMPGILAAARFVILPSFDEGTPRAVAEAMAMRRLVVATPASGALVRDGETGILAGLEPSTMATAIERALDMTAGERDRIIDAAQTLVQTTLSQAVIIDRLVKELAP